MLSGPNSDGRMSVLHFLEVVGAIVFEVESVPSEVFHLQTQISERGQG